MRLIKWLLGLLLFVVILIVAAAVILPMVIDPNDYRDEIAAQVKERTGRDLSIEDPMSLSVFPWVGLELGRVKLGNAAGFGDAPFASIDALQLKVKLQPLLSRRVEVDTVVVDGLQLNLAKKKSGESNWGSFSKDSKGKTGDKPSGPASGSEMEKFSIDVQGVDLSNGRIVWDDQQTGEGYVLSDVSLKTGKLALGSKVPVSLGLSIASRAPVLNMKIAIAGDANISESRKQISIAGLDITLDADGEGLPGDGLKIAIGADLSVDLLADTLALQGLAVKGPAIAIDGKVNGTGLTDKPVFTGDLNLQKTNLRELLVLAGIVVETTDPDVLSNVSGAVGFAATTSSLKLDPLRVQMDDSNLSGQINLLSFAGPVVRADLTLDSIDMDRYLPPAAADEAQAKSDSKAQPGPAPQSGPNGGDVAAGSKPMVAADPFAALRPLDLDATFKVDELKIMNARMQNTSLKITSKKGVMRIDPLTSNLYEGKINAAYTFDVRKATPRIHAREDLTGIQVGPLLKDVADFDKLLGTGEIHADLRMVGITEQEIRKSLNGTFRFNFSDGAYRGINLAQIIRDADGLLTGKKYPPQEDPRTDFSELSASATITNGIIKNKDLKAKSPLLRISGEGKVDLPRDKLDYTLTTELVGSLEGQGGLSSSELEGVEIPVRLTGDLGNPKPSIDPKVLLTKKTTKIIDVEKDKVKEKLKEKIKDENLQKQLDGVLKGIF